MKILSARLEQVHSLEAMGLPDRVKNALEAHKNNLVALYGQMTNLNKDAAFLERQANQILDIYQKELREAMKANK